MRLISADKLRKDVLDLPNCYNGFSGAYDKAVILDLVDEQPTVDAVEIVRCKDCKWWDDFPIASATPHIHECSASYTRRGTCVDDYCSWGERKENDTK